MLAVVVNLSRLKAVFDTDAIAGFIQERLMLILEVSVLTWSILAVLALILPKLIPTHVERGRVGSFPGKRPRKPGCARRELYPGARNSYLPQFLLRYLGCRAATSRPGISRRLPSKRSAG
jgi:hypothetical protein